MGLFKYALYAGILLGIAFLFEQIMITLYDLTLEGVAGELNAYFLLVTIYIILYVLGRAFFDKKIHPQSSKFILWASMLHIGTSLAIFFWNSNPLLLFIFPVIIVVGLWTKKSRTHVSKIGFRFHLVHPEFIDDRGGVCVVRSGARGFTLLKFLNLYPPFPMRELLLYLSNEQVECTFEVHHTAEGLHYTIGIISRDRNYDVAFECCLRDANRLRQFLKKQQIRVEDVSDYLNAQRAFYQPYFLDTPLGVASDGHPTRFPRVICTAGELVIEREFSEKAFTIHLLDPNFNAPIPYEFLEKNKEEFYLQFHLRPLSEMDITQKEETCNANYRDSIHRLSEGLEDNADFQAASYLFNNVKQASRENIEPLLDKNELERIKTIKKEMRNIKFGRRIGLWEVELYFIGESVLAQTLSVKLGGTNQQLPPQAFAPLTSRALLGTGKIVDSKQVHALLPHQSPGQWRRIYS